MRVQLANVACAQMALPVPTGGAFHWRAPSAACLTLITIAISMRFERELILADSNLCDILQHPTTFEKTEHAKYF